MHERTILQAAAARIQDCILVAFGDVYELKVSISQLWKRFRWYQLDRIAARWPLYKSLPFKIYLEITVWLQILGYTVFGSYYHSYFFLDSDNEEADWVHL